MVSATGTTNLGIEMLLAPTNQGTVGVGNRRHPFRNFKKKPGNEKHHSRKKKDGARSLVRDLPKCFELRLVNVCSWYKFLKG